MTKVQKQKTPWKKSVTSTASMPPAKTMKTANASRPPMTTGKVSIDAPATANSAGSPSMAMKKRAVTPGKIA